MQTQILGLQFILFQWSVADLFYFFLKMVTEAFVANAFVYNTNRVIKCDIMYEVCSIENTNVVRLLLRAVLTKPHSSSFKK